MHKFNFLTITLSIIVTCTSFLMIHSTLEAKSKLDNIIPPEIKNDSFYRAIYNLAKTENLQTILEIGSSSGDGSTEAFVFGIKQNPYQPLLFCMEVSKTRFKALKNRYINETFIRCYNVSSVPISDFPTGKEVSQFYHSTNTNLNNFSLQSIIGWLRRDIEYIKSEEVAQNGIEVIKSENNINTFDMVLIDGSEFTGMAEMKLIYGSRFILLDDINTFKNHSNYNMLLNDPEYTLFDVNFNLRNGYAIFEKLI